MAEKDGITEDLRHEIVDNADFLVETDRANLLEITLSFQSRVKPERHAWIDTRMGSSGDGFTVDLEDWAYEKSWDNAVATIDTEDISVARDVTRSWLQGDSLDTALEYCTDATVERK